MIRAISIRSISRGGLESKGGLVPPYSRRVAT